MNSCVPSGVLMAEQRAEQFRRLPGRWAPVFEEEASGSRRAQIGGRIQEV